jgi:hypothetical protein
VGFRRNIPFRFGVLALNRRSNAITDTETDAGRSQAPGDGTFLKLFTPIERVLNVFVLVHDCLLDFSYRLRDGISSFLHPELKFFFREVFFREFACSSHT